MTSSLRLPAGFAPVETELVFRAERDSGLADARLVKRAVDHPRANFVLRRRRLESAGSAEQERARMEADLRAAADGVTAVASGPFGFDDGAAGQLFAFEFQLLDRLRAEQVHALRVDGAWLSTLTYTAPLGGPGRLDREAVLRCLASYAPAADDSPGSDHATD